MLSKLFGSNTRVKVLKLFLLNPDTKFFVREIARTLDLQLNSVHRELSNLEEIGLLMAVKSEEEIEEEGVIEEKIKGKAKAKPKKSSKQEKKYYQVNKDFVFYKEMKNLIVKSQLLYEKDFTDKLKKIGDIYMLLLTGLFVGDNDSNIDLLIVGKFSKTSVSRIVKDLEKELVKEVNYTIMTEDEFKYRREIADVFLYNLMDGNKIVVVDKDGLN